MPRVLALELARDGEGRRAPGNHLHILHPVGPVVGVAAERERRPCRLSLRVKAAHGGGPVERYIKKTAICRARPPPPLPAPGDRRATRGPRHLRPERARCRRTPAAP